MARDPWAVVAEKPSIQPTGNDPWAVVSEEPNTVTGKVKKFATDTVRKIAQPTEGAFQESGTTAAKDEWAVVDTKPAKEAEPFELPAKSQPNIGAQAWQHYQDELLAGREPPDLNIELRPTWVQGQPEKPSFIQTVTGQKAGISPAEAGKATVALQAKQEGVSLPEYREGSRLPSQFISGAVNEGLMGIPKALAEAKGDTWDEPETTAEGIAAGSGKLLGFILGAPGKVTKLATQGMGKAFGEGLKLTGKEGAMERAMKMAVKESPALGAGMSTAGIGEALSKTNLDEALEVLMQNYGAGMQMGATFGGTRGAIPQETAKGHIKRLAVGIAALDTQRGAHPFDEREMAQKVFDYGIDAFFLWRGMGDEAVRILNERIVEQMHRLKKEGQPYVQTEDRFSPSSPSGEGGASKEAEPSPPPMKGGGGQAWDVVREEPGVLGGKEEKRVTLRDFNEEPYGFETEQGRFVERHDADGKLIGYEKIEEPGEVKADDQKGRIEAVQGAVGGGKAPLQIPLAERGKEAVEAGGKVQAGEGARVAPEEEVTPKKKERKVSKSPFAELVKQDPVYAAIEDAYYGGGFKMDALLRDYDKDTVKQLSRRRIGLVTKAGKYTLDTLAEEHGFESGDDLMNAMLNAKPIKQAAKELKAEQEKAMGIDPALLKRGFTPTKEGVRADELYKGDKVIVDGETFEVKDIDADENVTLKDGRTIKVGGYTKLDAEAMKRGKQGRAAEEDFGFGETKGAEGETKEPEPETKEPKIEKTGDLKQGVMEGMSEAETFGLTPDDAEIGQSKAGEKPPPKQTGMGFASSGQFAHTERAAEAPTPEQRRTDYVNRRRFFVDMPELVEIVKNLTGKYPKIARVLKAMGGNANGVFYPGEGLVKIRADLYKDTEQALKTLSHEIGHLVDWLPDKTMSRGNILGRIASFKGETREFLDQFFRLRRQTEGYRADTLEEYPGAPGKALTDADRARLRAEAEAKAKEAEQPDRIIVEKIMREVPRYETAGITPDMILDIMRGRIDRERAPEVYRWLQEATTADKKAAVKKALNGLVDERLAAMGERRQVGTELVEEEVTTTIHGKKATKAEIRRRFEELLKDEIRARRLYTAEQVLDEAKKWTHFWKPFNPSDNKKYTRYRYKSSELYADLLSGLLNDPELGREKAPTFHKAFFNWLEKKPEVKEIYDEIQERITNPEALTGTRATNVREMFKKGEEKKKETEQAEQKITLRELGRQLKKVLIDENEEALRKIKEARKRGYTPEDENDPRYWLEELPYLSAKIYDHLRRIEADIYDPAKKDGLVIDDLGEYMFYRRVSGERSDKANPLGHTKQTALQQLEAMKKKLGPEKFAKLEEHVQKLWQHRQREIIPLLEDAEMYSHELMEKIRDNEVYATFDVTKALEKRYGRNISGQIYKQLGTHEEIRNPFVATVMKDVALIRAAEIKMAKASIVDMLRSLPGEMKPADTRWNGKFHEPVDPKDPNQGMISYLENGKVKAFYAPKDIAESFNREPFHGSMVLEVWNAINRPLRAVLVNRNPLWMAANVIRDFFGTVKHIPGLSAPKLLKYYKRAFKDAYLDVFKDKETQAVSDMLKRKMLVVDRQYATADIPGETELDRVIQAFGKSPVQYRNKVVKPFMKLWEYLGKAGKFTERLGKIAGYKYLTAESGKSEREIAHLVRTRVGTPDIYRRGAWNVVTNNVFLFSNVGKEGFRSSWEAYREGKAEYIWKTIKFNIVPKLIFNAALYGAFGDDLKKVAGKVSKYHRENYTIVPLGLTDMGKGVYFAIPQDYTGQVIGGLFNNLISGDLFGKGTAMSYGATNSPYNLNPYISLGTDLFNYYMLGLNPYDSYRGQNVLTPQEYKAGGWDANKKMLKHTWNELGGGSIHKFRYDDLEKVKGELETALGIPPGNILGRFLKVSSYGEKEEYKETAREVEKGEARRQLDVKARIKESINEAGGKSSIAEIGRLYRELKADKALPQSVSVAQFRRTYERYTNKTKDDPRIDAVIESGSNEVKAALMRRYQEEMDPGEFKALRDQLLREGQISEDVLKRMKAGTRTGTQ